MAQDKTTSPSVAAEEATVASLNFLIKIMYQERSKNANACVFLQYKKMSKNVAVQCEQELRAA